MFAAEQKRAQELRRELGFGPLQQFFFNFTAEEAPVFIQGSVPEFEYPRRDLPPNVRFVGALLPEAPGGELPGWWADLDGGRPVVLVTQGTVKVDPSMLLYPAIEALRNEAVLVVGTTGGLPTEQVPGRYRADNVRLETFIPFADLLPRVDVVVTNGGYGGVQQALAHGVPVVVAGVTEGKNEVATRVGWSGTGLNLKTDTPTSERIGESVRRVLTEPSFRAQARVLQEAYARYDAGSIAADHVEQLLSI